MAGKVTFDASQLDKFVQFVGTWPERVMGAGQTELERQMRLERQRIVNQQLSGQTLMVRSGNLRRAGASSAEIQGNEIVGKISFTASYARAQEFGADIRPGPGKKRLTIPLTAALTDMGVQRGPITSFPDVVIKIIDEPFVDSFSGRVIPKGALVAFQEVRKSQIKSAKQAAYGYAKGRQYSKLETGYGVAKYDSLDDRIKTGELIPLFWLVSRVKIKPKHFAGNQLRRDFPQITKNMIAAIRKSVSTN